MKRGAKLNMCGLCGVIGHIRTSCPSNPNRRAPNNPRPRRTPIEVVDFSYDLSELIEESRRWSPKIPSGCLDRETMRDRIGRMVGNELGVTDAGREAN
jgi:hypothetical protein